MNEHNQAMRSVVAALVQANVALAEEVKKRTELLIADPLTTPAQASIMRCFGATYQTYLENELQKHTAMANSLPTTAAVAPIVPVKKPLTPEPGFVTPIKRPVIKSDDDEEFNIPKKKVQPAVKKTSTLKDPAPKPRAKPKKKAVQPKRKREEPSDTETDSDSEAEPSEDDDDDEEEEEKKPKKRKLSTHTKKQTSTKDNDA